MTAFVAGATGHTGREVVRALRQRGEPALAHVRPDSPRLDEWRRRFEALGAEVDVTAWEPEAVKATFERRAPTHVFACLGTTQDRTRADARAGRPGGYEAVDVGMTIMLLEAAAGMVVRPRFIYLSASGVGGLITNEYYRARARVEDAVRRSGVPYAIVRPSIIGGDRRDVDRPAERIAAAALGGAFGIVAALGGKRIAARYAPITNVELGDAIVRAAFGAEIDRVFEGEALRS
jgi:uncharacterized protein YbjT (DUF2867 family)